MLPSEEVSFFEEIIFYIYLHSHSNFFLTRNTERHRDELVVKAHLARTRALNLSASSDSQDDSNNSRRGSGTGAGRGGSTLGPGFRSAISSSTPVAAPKSGIYFSASGIGVSDGSFRSHESPAKAPI